MKIYYIFFLLIIFNFNTYSKNKNKLEICSDFNYGNNFLDNNLDKGINNLLLKINPSIILLKTCSSEITFNYSLDIDFLFDGIKLNEANIIIKGKNATDTLGFYKNKFSYVSDSGYTKKFKTQKFNIYFSVVSNYKLSNFLNKNFIFKKSKDDFSTRKDILLDYFFYKKELQEQDLNYLEMKSKYCVYDFWNLFTGSIGFKYKISNKIFLKYFFLIDMCNKEEGIDSSFFTNLIFNYKKIFSWWEFLNIRFNCGFNHGIHYTKYSNLQKFNIKNEEYMLPNKKVLILLFNEKEDNKLSKLLKIKKNIYRLEFDMNTKIILKKNINLFINFYYCKNNFCNASNEIKIYQNGKKNKEKYLEKTIFEKKETRRIINYLFYIKPRLEFSFTKIVKPFIEVTCGKIKKYHGIYEKILNIKKKEPLILWDTKIGFNFILDDWLNEKHQNLFVQNEDIKNVGLLEKYKKKNLQYGFSFEVRYNISGGFIECYNRALDIILVKLKPYVNFILCELWKIKWIIDFGLDLNNLIWEESQWTLGGEDFIKKIGKNIDHFSFLKFKFPFLCVDFLNFDNSVVNDKTKVFKFLNIKTEIKNFFIFEFDIELPKKYLKIKNLIKNKEMEIIKSRYEIGYENEDSIKKTLNKDFLIKPEYLYNSEEKITKCTRISLSLRFLFKNFNVKFGFLLGKHFDHVENVICGNKKEINNIKNDNFIGNNNNDNIENNVFIGNDKEYNKPFNKIFRLFFFNIKNNYFNFKFTFNNASGAYSIIDKIHPQCHQKGLVPPDYFVSETLTYNEDIPKFSENLVKKEFTLVKSIDYELLFKNLRIFKWVENNIKEYFEINIQKLYIKFVGFILLNEKLKALNLSENLKALKKDTEVPINTILNAINSSTETTTFYEEKFNSNFKDRIRRNKLNLVPEWFHYVLVGFKSSMNKYLLIRFEFFACLYQSLDIIIFNQDICHRSFGGAKISFEIYV